MKRTTCLALVLVLALGLLSACSPGGSEGTGGPENTSSGGSEEKTYVIGASFSQTNITPFGNHMYLDLVELCKEKGWELISMDAERDATKEAQNMETLLLQDLDLLFYWPYDREAAVVNAQRAYEEGIPVITVNADVAEEGWEYTAAYVGPDQFSLSKDVGEWVVEQTGGQGNIVVIDGTAGTTQYLLRMEGFEEVIGNYPDLNIIAHEYVAGDRAAAITFMENCLTTYGDQIDVVYCPGADNVAIGAAQAIREAGRDDILICSIDGMQEAFDLIKQGEITMTVLQKPYYLIEKFGEVAEKIFAGEEIGDRLQYNRYTLVTAENVDEEEAEY